MVSLVRSGPRSLLITTSRKSELIDFLEDEFGAIVVEMETVMKESDENHTIVFLIRYDNEEKTKYTKTDALVVFVDPLVLACRLRSSIRSGLVETLRSGPQALIMRSAGNLQEVANKVKDDLGGELASYDDCSDNGFEDRTIIGITDKPLYKSMTADDLHPKFIRLDEDYFKIKQVLRRHSIKYLNLGVGSKGWSSLEIRIYDSFGAYELHYKRLLTVLDSLQLGLLTGESWSKDQPRALLFIDVYSIRLLTFYSPAEIKKILFGMEYLEDGRRIIDYDLYQDGKKIQWASLFPKEKNLDKKAKAAEARTDLYSKLSENTRKELLEIEKEILKTRY
ncbi:hypothetical protein [Gudongella sp. DL1XJH-153]|uniref:hypothetical protein n=1 Tax=Gudongella sp. DL1XJH-153 TaxID=3409804 RepID=UPI003BB77666